MKRNYEAMAVLSTAFWQYRALHAVRNLWIQCIKNVNVPNFASDHMGLVQAENKFIFFTRSLHFHRCLRGYEFAAQPCPSRDEGFVL